MGRTVVRIKDNEARTQALGMGMERRELDVWALRGLW